ncbi:MAG: LPXTG cell wall anchor domain-containing protein [Propionibacteriaceae bacterium]|nr:LPXTG cell wall anchor domain-containing protein [Propionibacteriaceae bacterium]
MPATGATIGWGAALAGLLAFLVGTGLVIWAWRRRRDQEEDTTKSI